MKRLILMRHAKTEPWTEGVDDHGRALTALGHEAAGVMARALKGEGWAPEKAIVSTARRTRETWRHLADVFGACERVLEDELYLAGERGIADIISAHDGAGTLMILGHNPGLHDLSLHILRAAGSADHQASIRIAAKLPTGAAVLFEAPEDGAFRPVHFRLQNFIKPKDLLPGEGV
ncbi:MAG: histidine phosphatase family protein [Pseudomonadota bacterium]